MKKRKSNLEKFYDEGVAYLNDYISSIDIWKRQELFLNCIKVIDKTFLDSITTEGDEKGQFFTDILHFAYPVLIEYVYTDEFEELPAAVLAKLTDDSLLEYRTFLCSCQLVGWSAYLLELERLGIVTTKDFCNRSKIIFKQKNHHIELIEAKYIQYYEQIICTQIEKDSRYLESIKNREDIIDRMKQLCFVWNEHFIGYNGDQDVENYFRDLAYLDSIHDTEWDMYPDDVLFNDVYYASFVDSVVDLSGYAIKHIYFINVLREKHPELLVENLFYLINTKDDLLHLIRENGDLSVQQAEEVLKVLSLSAANKGLYENTQASCAPLIKISSSQYIHSCAGSLYRPFSFMLDNITILYPNICDKNRNKREAVFRNQLYEMMPNFHCIDHQIVIKKNGQRITDIDAAAIDYETGEIALFQLKWQDHTSLSPKTLISKSNNYTLEVTQWINKVSLWIENSSETEIASLLGIKAKYVDKSKIYLFAFGREHGNYSGATPDTPNCTWVQWYHFLNYILRLEKNSLLISKMHKELKEESPYTVTIKSRKRVYKYGKYRFVY